MVAIRSTHSERIRVKKEDIMKKVTEKFDSKLLEINGITRTSCENIDEQIINIEEVVTKLDSILQNTSIGDCDITTKALTFKAEDVHKNLESIGAGVAALQKNAFDHLTTSIIASGVESLGVRIEELLTAEISAEPRPRINKLPDLRYKGAFFTRLKYTPVLRTILS